MPDNGRLQRELTLSYYERNPTPTPHVDVVD